MAYPTSHNSDKSARNHYHIEIRVNTSNNSPRKGATFFVSKNQFLLKLQDTKELCFSAIWVSSSFYFCEVIKKVIQASVAGCKFFF